MQIGFNTRSRNPIASALRDVPVSPTSSVVMGRSGKHDDLLILQCVKMNLQ